MRQRRSTSATLASLADASRKICHLSSADSRRLRRGCFENVATVTSGIGVGMCWCGGGGGVLSNGSTGLYICRGGRGPSLLKFPIRATLRWLCERSLGVTVLGEMCGQLGDSRVDAESSPATHLLLGWTA
jgi:hypothetical protein